MISQWWAHGTWAMLLVFDAVMTMRHGRCRCGRTGRLYQRIHPPGWLMLVWAVVLTVIVVLWFLVGMNTVTAVWTVVAGLGWIRWWTHEQDRLKRRLREAAKRVVVTATGLQVRPT